MNNSLIKIINSIANFCDIVYWKIVVLTSNIRMQIVLFFRGIEYGKHIVFFGAAKFKRSNSAIIKIGNDCTFRSKTNSNLIGINRRCILTALEPKAKLVIGNNCGFSGTVIGCFNKIIIGNNVKCGANSLITDSDWHLGDLRSGEPKEIIIKDNVWLGVNATVMKGVTIGRNSVIGANSVVTKDVPDNVIAAGNPCKIIKQLV